MPTIQDTLDAALLADAAYVDLTPVLPGHELSGPALTLQLLRGGRLTDTEADYIAAHYDLVATQMSGGYAFQAMVFRRKPPTGQPGDYVLAIRGSQEGVDFLQGAELTLFARARDQAAAMYSFISQVESGGYGLPANVRFDVVGHSLGGHLVQLLASEHPGMVNQAYTFNGAGLGNALAVQPADIAITLRAVWAPYHYTPINVTNVISGLAVVPNWITGPKLGAAHEIFIENQAYPWQNHLIGAAVDTLALYRAFESLVGSLQFDKEAVTNILRAASRDSLSSLPSTPAHTFTSLESITTASTIKGLSALGASLVAHFDDAVPGTYGEYQMVAQNVTRHPV